MKPILWISSRKKYHRLYHRSGVYTKFGTAPETHYSSLTDDNIQDFLSRIQELKTLQKTLTPKDTYVKKKVKKKREEIEGQTSFFD